MWDGTLSGVEFHAESMAFLSLWNNAETSRNHWQWQPRADSTAGGYLSLENVPTAFPNNCEGETELNFDENDSPGDSADAATLMLDPLSTQQHASFTYHVIYSESYRVPILFFQSYYSDGGLLKLEDIQRILTAESRQLLEKSPWTFLTQEEHPFLHRPWFSFHPCGTSTMMAMILSHRLRSKEEKLNTEELSDSLGLPEDSEFSRTCDGLNPLPSISTSGDMGGENLLQLAPSSVPGHYLLAWLSIVGQVARLDLSLSLFKKWFTGGANYSPP